MRRKGERETPDSLCFLWLFTSERCLVFLVSSCWHSSIPISDVQDIISRSLIQQFSPLLSVLETSVFLWLSWDFRIEREFKGIWSPFRAWMLFFLCVYQIQPRPLRDTSAWRSPLSSLPVAASSGPVLVRFIGGVVSQHWIPVSQSLLLFTHQQQVAPLTTWVLPSRAGFLLGFAHSDDAPNI